jgi:hypothetical protein
MHVIDFEGNRAYGILEYGLVTLQNNAITDVISANCCKNLSQPVSHFTEHSRFHSNCIGVNFEKHLPLFIQKRMTGFFCAHGNAVEDRLLRQYCPTPGTTITEWINNFSWGPWIDTHRLYRKYYPAAKHYKLAELVRYFNLEMQLENLAQGQSVGEKLTFHRAPYDALATALLLQNFINLFRINDVSFLLNH